MKAMNNEMKLRLRRLARKLLVVKEFSLDTIRYLTHSAPMDRDMSVSPQIRHLEAQLTKDYHRVEKGLSLRLPKKPFGLDVLDRLNQLLSANPRVTEYPFGEFSAEAVAALEEWNHSGTRSGLVTKDSGILPSLKMDQESLQNFFESRRSCRDFNSDIPVDQETLETAVRMATNTPSVCNRQSWRVRFFREQDVARVISHQNGNAGFGNSIPVLAVITVDSRLFAGPGERNQGWIDGGLFAMSLVWALHGVGLQTCMLNWSMTNKQSDSLRAEIDVDSHEQIIVLVAVGHGNPGFRIARSARRSLEEVAQFP